MNITIRISALILSLLSINKTTLGNGNISSRAEIKKVLSCLVNDATATNEIINLYKVLPNIFYIKASYSLIPGTANSKGEEYIMKIILFNAKHTRGKLFFIDMEHPNTPVILTNMYNLSGYKHSWAAGEGNGGLATYIAIGKYVDEIDKQTIIKINKTDLDPKLYCSRD